MKNFFLIFFCFAIITINGYSQDSILDRIESSFERVIHTTAFPCAWSLQRIVKANGQPFFIRDDSTKYEVEFFKTQSLTFYNPEETNFETSKAFYAWEVNQMENKKEISILKIEESAEETFVIFEIKSNTNGFYRLLVTADNITYSIKLYAKGMSIENQLDELKLLCFLNAK